MRIAVDEASLPVRVTLFVQLAPDAKPQTIEKAPKEPVVKSIVEVEPDFVQLEKSDLLLAVSEPQPAKTNKRAKSVFFMSSE